ncbi:MAG: GGDEF domain-containing protein [Pseudomonadota bacterium]
MAVLHGLLEETTGDIFIRVDPAGFIETASSNISLVSQDYSQLLLKPHLSDLADPLHAGVLREQITRVLAGGRDGSESLDWLKFPAKCSGSEAGGKSSQNRIWYALCLRIIEGESVCVTGALGLLRVFEPTPSDMSEARSIAMVDPLTGLANRHAFSASLRGHLGKKESGIVTLFEVDRMRAFFMQYGQGTVDEIIRGFAQFLEAMVQDDFELAQLDAERFCILLPDMSRKAARRWVQEVLETFSSLTLVASPRLKGLSASAGLARIEGSVDTTLRQAELALVMARARGGMQVAECPRTDAVCARVIRKDA